MNLAIHRKTSEKRVRRTVLHEFGHVLGCVHEHVSPAAKIPWDKPAVYAHYRKQGWGKDTVDRNVLRATKKPTYFSRFDRESIMIYAISPGMTRNGFRVRWNTTLSKTDKSFIAMMYPPDDVWCNRCDGYIDTSNVYEGHKYCENHRNYLCAECYDSSHRRRLVRQGRCSYLKPPVR